VRLVRFRNYMLSGMFILLPSVVTLYILYLLFSFVDGLLGELITSFLGRSIPGLGLLATIVLILTAGFLATNIIGRKLLSRAEQLFYNLPLISKIYTSAKQITRAFIHRKKLDIHPLVLIEYPRIGIYSLAFVFGKTTGEVVDKTKEKELLNVFLPTTPNPTLGYFLIVPKKDVVPLPMSIDKGFKFLISGGVYVPDKE